MAFSLKLTADRTTISAGVNNFDAPPTGFAPVYDGTPGDRLVLAAASGAATPCFADAAEYAEGVYQYGYFQLTGSPCQSGGAAATVTEGRCGCSSFHAEPALQRNRRMLYACRTGQPASGHCGGWPWFGLGRQRGQCVGEYAIWYRYRQRAGRRPGRLCRIEPGRLPA